jgi:LPS O-antigen subunit length determinant protein (WzzB/FepE family)
MDGTRKEPPPGEVVLPFGALVGIVVAVLIALLVWLGLIEFIL